MTEKTKACNLTEGEIEVLIAMHGRNLNNISTIKQDHTTTIERINYLNKRLKSFNETEVKSENTAAGWSTSNG